MEVISSSEEVRFLDHRSDSDGFFPVDYGERIDGATPQRLRIFKGP